MYFLFLDDSPINKNNLKATCLGGFIIKKEDYLILQKQLEELKIKYGLLPSDPIKWSPTEGNKNYKKQREIKEQNKFKATVLQLLSKAKIKIIAAFIDNDQELLKMLKSKHTKNYVLLSYEKKALEYLSQRFQFELQDINKASTTTHHGIILIDEPSKNKIISLIKHYNHVWHNGSKGVGKNGEFDIKFDLLMDSIFFSHGFGCDGIQLADFVISSLRHSTENSRYKFPKLFKNKIRQINGNMKGIGLVVYPSNSTIADNLIKNLNEN